MNSLSSMSATSCLQNRDASSYYSMFHHDPLSSYARSCGVASQSAASHMGSYGSSLTSSSSSTGSGSSGMIHNLNVNNIPHGHYLQVFLVQECRCHSRFLVNHQTLPPTTGHDSSNMSLMTPHLSCDHRTSVICCE